MNVAENLYDYLKHNDKAELVGFGTFYVKNSSARINELTGTIQPPKREISFSKEQNGDRSFVAFMAKHEFISEDTAYTWIKQYSDSLNDKIQRGLKITLGKLGKIEKGLLEDYTFIPSEDLNLLENSFALGELKNVQTFDSSEEQIDLIHTKEPQNTAAEQPKMPKEFEDKQSEIETQIENARKIKEEEKIKETESQTEQRIIQHSQATIQTEVTKPENQTKQTPDSDIDNSTKEDKTQQTINRAAEFKENVVVEDIKPAKPQEEKKISENTEATAQSDVLIKKAEAIVRKHSRKTDRKRNPKRTNKRKRNWLIFLWIVIVLLILCLTFIGLHWLGMLKDFKAIKPITDKLSYYIPVKESKPVEAIQPLEETNTQSVTEDTQTYTEAEQEADIYTKENNTNIIVTADNTQNKTTTPKKKTVKKENKDKKTQEIAPKSEKETVVEDKTPIIVQNHSKLGFDVVVGAYSDKSKAEAQAKKARRLGYDGYVIAKIKSGTPIYYASYGSRRSQSDATELCTMIKNRLSGDFYIISR